MLNSLSIVIQQACRTLHVVVEKEHEEVVLPVGEAVVNTSDLGFCKEAQKLETPIFGEPSTKESSWVAHMMEAQQQGRGVSVSLDYQTGAQKRI